MTQGEAMVMGVPESWGGGLSKIAGQWSSWESALGGEVWEGRRKIALRRRTQHIKFASFPFLPGTWHPRTVTVTMCQDKTFSEHRVQS